MDGYAGSACGWRRWLVRDDSDSPSGVGGWGALKEKGGRLAPPAAVTLGFGDCVPSRMYRRLGMTGNGRGMGNILTNQSVHVYIDRRAGRLISEAEAGWSSVMLYLTGCLSMVMGAVLSSRYILCA